MDQSTKVAGMEHILQATNGLVTSSTCKIDGGSNAICDLSGTDHDTNQTPDRSYLSVNVLQTDEADE